MFCTGAKWSMLIYLLSFAVLETEQEQALHHWSALSSWFVTSSIITFFFQPLTRLLLCRRKPPDTTQHICFRLGILHFKPLHLGNDLLPLNISVCYKGRSRFIICHTVADLFWHCYNIFFTEWGGVGAVMVQQTHTHKYFLLDLFCCFCWNSTYHLCVVLFLNHFISVPFT